MPRNEALWQEVVTSRADGARVAYAKWLEGQGARERAQLIMLQLEIAQGLGSGSAQAWVNSSRLERDARALVRKHLAAWKTDERHDTAFHYKGFPARVAVNPANRAELGKLKALPVEHVLLRGFSSPAIFDELAARGVRALTIGANHAAAVAALARHPLVHQLAWLRAQGVERAGWDALEAAAPRALLYVDADRVSIEQVEHDGGDTTIAIDEAMLKRPCWRCPYTTWGPRPTLARVLACADAIRGGTAKRPQPGMFSYEVSLARDVERPPKTFAEVVAPETWDPEKE
ncbi:MAG: hypothetical protein ACM31C_34345 [Acidobacteriota bacterium]